MEMTKSESIKTLAAALCKAQHEMSAAKKDSVNPFFKNRYANMSAVMSAIREAFFNNGLSYSQFPEFKSGEDGKYGMAGVETILMHTSGEFLSSKLLLPISKTDAQACGSAITYARRYALQAIAGIPSEDDDGHLATKRQSTNKASPFVHVASDSLDKSNLGYVLKSDGLPNVHIGRGSRQDSYVMKCLQAIGVSNFNNASEDQKKKIMQSIPK